MNGMGKNVRELYEKPINLLSAKDFYIPNQTQCNQPALNSGMNTHTGPSALSQ